MRAFPVFLAACVAASRHDAFLALMDHVGYGDDDLCPDQVLDEMTPSEHGRNYDCLSVATACLVQGGGKIKYVAADGRTLTEEAIGNVDPAFVAMLDQISDGPEMCPPIPEGDEIDRFVETLVRSSRQDPPKEEL